MSVALNFRRGLNHVNNLIDEYQNSPTAKIDAILLEFNYLKRIFTRLFPDERRALNSVEDRIKRAQQIENAKKRALSFSQDEPMPMPLSKRSSLKNIIITHEEQVVLPVQPQSPFLSSRTYESYPAEVPPERMPSKSPVGTPLVKLPMTLFLEERGIDEGRPESSVEDFDLLSDQSNAGVVPAVATAPAASAKAPATVMPTPLRNGVINLTEMERQAVAAAAVIRLTEVDPEGSEYGSI
jgi:hypothetical protein